MEVVTQWLSKIAKGVLVFFQVASADHNGISAVEWTLKDQGEARATFERSECPTLLIVNF